MKILTTYLSGLPLKDRAAFAARCGTSLGYLRKAVSVGQKLGESLCMHIERESHGAITCEALRPDVPWDVLRGKCITTPASIAQEATEAVASKDVKNV